MQFIDVRDVAEWSVRGAEAKLVSNFNAKRPAYPLTVGTMLDTLRDVVGDDAEFCEASTEFRNEQKVRMGSDPPVWIPGDGETAGPHRRSNARAISAGLTFRPLATTVADTLASRETLRETRQMNLKAGLTRESAHGACAAGLALVPRRSRPHGGALLPWSPLPRLPLIHVG